MQIFLIESVTPNTIYILNFQSYIKLIFPQIGNHAKVKVVKSRRMTQCANGKKCVNIRSKFACADILYTVETQYPRFSFLFFRFLGEEREASQKLVARSRAGSGRFVKSAKSWVEGSFYRDRTDHPSPKVTCTVEGSLLCREVMGGLGARFA